ncbi:MAG: hypothetical protein KDD66_02935 [Bdellovibrionales bacterium]|nr:hypothetical protein [Bdellovibrionales bacterium]
MCKYAKSFLLTLALVLPLALLVSLAFADPGNVSIRIDQQSLKPETVQVSPGTTIIWVNSAGALAKVQFLSNAVSTTCKAPRGFIVGSKGIFESEEIPGGDVASLCFLERQTYTYKVELFEQGDSGKELAQTFHGTVVVTK